MRLERDKYNTQYLKVNINSKHICNIMSTGISERGERLRLSIHACMYMQDFGKFYFEFLRWKKKQQIFISLCLHRVPMYILVYISSEVYLIN